MDGIFLIILMVPGIPFAILLSLFRRMGDGSANESGMGEFFMWSIIFGSIAWCFIIGILGGLFQHWMR